MRPFPALTPFAAYSPSLILPVLLFFVLQAPPQALLGTFLSFTAGVGCAGLSMPARAALLFVPLGLMLGVGVTLVIFLVPSVHPALLRHLPLAVVPAVLLGVVLSLLVMLVNPLFQDGVPLLNPLWFIAIFGYGCVMALILVLAEARLLGAVLGKDWRSAST